MIYNGDTYYYMRNLMGEIVGLVDAEGYLVVQYYYDAWGELLYTEDYTNDSIGYLNPFKYKDYYYDSELGFYYLNSRYYDPETSRFINASETIPGIGAGILDYNLFAYCNNNPIVASEAPAASITHTSSINNMAINYVTVTPIEVMDTMVYYNVPLYYQDDTNLCWAFCQVMVDDYRAGYVDTNEGAMNKAKSIAISIYGEKDWDNPGWPTNAGKHILPINSVYDLYRILCNNGPIYVSYYDSTLEEGHLVVATGVNLTKGIIYTNNPWMVPGEQTYEEFMLGFAGMPNDYNMLFHGCFYVR